MKSLVESIEKLKKTDIGKEVNSKIKEFKQMGKKSSTEIFKELCFCLLTANFHAERAIKIQNKIKDGFFTLSRSNLKKELRTLGHRFPNARANYIFEARKYKDSLKNTIKSFDTEKEIREWIVSNIKGLGYKESSHFLRNIGYHNLAIIDFHIIDILVDYNMIQQPKTLTKRKYLEIEELLQKTANKLDLNLAELDLYLWYMETGKILK